LNYIQVVSIGYVCHANPPFERVKRECTRRGDAQKLSLVSAAFRITRHDLISFGNHVLKRVMPVGESRVEHGRNLLNIFGATDRFGATGPVEDIVGSKQLVYYAEVVISHNLFKEPTDDGLVLFSGHHDTSLLQADDTGQAGSAGDVVRRKNIRRIGSTAPADLLYTPHQSLRA
jgi:hypothetical protein